MHQKSASNNDSKQCGLAAESNLFVKYNSISGRLHELHFGFSYLEPNTVNVLNDAHVLA